MLSQLLLFFLLVHCLPSVFAQCSGSSFAVGNGTTTFFSASPTQVLACSPQVDFCASPQTNPVNFLGYQAAHPNYPPNWDTPSGLSVKPGVWKDPWGYVHFLGALETYVSFPINGTTELYDIVRLPVGYRPDASQVYVPCTNIGGGGPSLQACWISFGQGNGYIAFYGIPGGALPGPVPSTLNAAATFYLSAIPPLLAIA